MTERTAHTPFCPSLSVHMRQQKSQVIVIAEYLGLEYFKTTLRLCVCLRSKTGFHRKMGEHGRQVPSLLSCHLGQKDCSPISAGKDHPITSYLDEAVVINWL